ncbi:neuregulin binding [Branchiostoma belcheri]|nr:neuregulin binding [Branchiostoma belcheri]
MAVGRELFNVRPRAVLYIGLLVSLASGFNVDTQAPIVKRGEEGSLFGFSVALHRVDADNSSTTLFLVGAPQAKYFGEPFSPATGMVYTCPVSTFSEDCKPLDIDYAIPQPIESLAGRWLGVTLQSAGPGRHVLVCAPRFTRWAGNDPSVKSFSRSGQARLVGRCYHLRADLSLVDAGDAGPGMWEPCEMFSGSSSGSRHCLSGTGASIFQNSNDDRVDLAMGTPTVYYSQGGMVFVRHKGDPDSLASLELENAPSIYSTEEQDRGGEDGYLGFSVTVMDTTQGVKFVAGAPRAARGKGAVVVYRWHNETSEWKTQTMIDGQQLASGFGYALCNADVTGDSVPDLIVAAPFYFNTEGDQGGAIYVYKTSMSGNQLFEGEPLAVKYGSRHSHFGLAVTNAGDLNKDGFQDIAVGAPYEGEGGVVYIIQGSGNGLSTEHIQRIDGSSLPGDLGLTTFGFSLSGGLDVDGNSYPDLLVGAFQSDTVVSLRSRPIIYVEPRLRVNPPVLDTEMVLPGCAMRNGRKVPCFEVEMIFQRTATGDEAVDNRRFRVAIRLELDKPYRERTGQMRVFFPGARKHVLQRSIRLPTASGKAKAVRVKAYIKEGVTDLSPIQVTLDYKLNVPSPSNTSTGVAPTFNTYPVLHPNSNTSVKLELRIAEDKSEGFYVRGTSVPENLYISPGAGPIDFQFFYQVLNQGPKVRPSTTLYLFLPVDISNGQLFTWGSVTRKDGEAEVSCKQETDEPILSSDWSGKADIIGATQTNWNLVEEVCIDGAASWHIYSCTVGRLAAGDQVLINVGGNATGSVALKEVHRGNQLTFHSCTQIKSETKSPVSKASVSLLIEATVKTLSVREKRDTPSIWSPMPGEDMEEFGSRLCQQLGSGNCSDCLQTAFWCGWCSEQEFSGSRCDMVHRLTDRGCPKDDVMSPRSQTLITRGTTSRRMFGLARNEPDPPDKKFLFFRPQEAIMQMRPGRSMPLYFEVLPPPPPVVKAIDLYILMDLSKSMADDLFLLWDSLDKLVQTVLQGEKHVRLGFGTFVDKTVLPFTNTFNLEEPCKGCAPAFSFRHVQVLTDDFSQFSHSVTEQEISGNIDAAEGLLDALMQATVCQEQIGWREDAARVILVLTDAPFHWAGDGRLGGIVQPNDGLCHMDQNGEDAESTKQDYPTVALLKDRMLAHRVTPLFAVTPQSIELYEELSTLISSTPSNFSSVYRLQSDSKNIVDIVEDVMKRNLTSLLQSKHRTELYVQSPTNSAWVSLHKVSPDMETQEAVQYTANVTFLSCNGKTDPLHFDIMAAGVPHSLRVTVEPICQCACDDIEPMPSHPSCSGHGSLNGCGGCSCDPDRYGAKCECDALAVNDPLVCRRTENEPVCSGRGECVCGVCHCHPVGLPDPAKKYSGQFCQCDNFSCDYADGKYVEDQIAVDVSVDNVFVRKAGREQLAIVPQVWMPAGRLICNDRGTCSCGICQCQYDYRGPSCEDCPTCPGMCERLRLCGDCIARESSNCSAECGDTKITTVDELSDGYSDGVEWKLCRFKYFGNDRLERLFVFAYGYEGNQVVLQYSSRSLSPSQIPGAPGSLQLQAVSNTILLTWTAPSAPETEVDGYQIGYGPGTPDQEYVRVGGDVRTHVLKDLASPDTDAPLLSPVGLKTQVLGPNTILVSWTDPNMIENQLVENRYYTVRWMAVGSPDRKTSYINTNNLEYSVTNLRPYTKYEFSVKIMEGKRLSPYSVTVVNSTSQQGEPIPAAQVPGTPASLRLQPGPNSIRLMWAPPAGPDSQLQGYVIGYGQGVADVERVQVGPYVTTYVLRNLEPDSQYVVSLRAFNRIGDGEPVYVTASTSLTAAPDQTGPLMPPVGVKAVVLSPNTILVFWIDPTVGESQAGMQRFYTIRWMSFGAPDRTTVYVNTTSTEYSVSGLKPYTQYEFSVKVVEGRRESPYSLSVVNRTSQANPGTPPQDITVQGVEENPTQVIVTWLPPEEPNGMITGYVILYTTDLRKPTSEWGVRQLSDGNKLQFKVTDLEPGTRYYFSVQARNSMRRLLKKLPAVRQRPAPCARATGTVSPASASVTPTLPTLTPGTMGSTASVTIWAALTVVGSGVVVMVTVIVGWKREETAPVCVKLAGLVLTVTAQWIQGLCNNHGVCSCGVCQCEEPYTGPTCEDCPTCQGSCTQLRGCAECVANNNVDCDADCRSTSVSYMDDLPQGPLPAEHTFLFYRKWKLCEFVDPEKNLPFVFSYDPDSDRIVLHLRPAEVLPSSTTPKSITTTAPEPDQQSTTATGGDGTPATRTRPRTTPQPSRISRLLPCCVLSANERCQDKCGRVLLTATNNQQILRSLISACGIPSVTDPLWNCFLQANSADREVVPPPTPQPLPERKTTTGRLYPAPTSTTQPTTTISPTTTLLPTTTTAPPTTTVPTTIPTTVATTTEVKIPERNCEDEICPVTWCSYPYRPPGTCCPICEDCDYEGKFVENGDIFVLEEDVCTICLCALGWVDCSPAFCQELSCNKTIVPPGKCCPVCEDDYILLGGLPDYSPTSEIDIYGEEFDNCRPIYGPICSGHGTCVNGACQCDSFPEEPEKLYYGPHCECNNFDCDSHEGQICGGHGQCECSSCLCDVGWEGSACNCSVAVEPCTALNGQLCNRHGVCECGACQCEDGYTGPTCEDCTDCPELQCEDFETCVDCMYWELTSGCTEDCNNFESPVIMVDKLNITEELKAGRKQCQYIAEDLLDECYANYTYGYNEEGIIDIHIPSAVTCDYPDYSNYDWDFDEEDLPDFEYK